MKKSRSLAPLLTPLIASASVAASQTFMPEEAVIPPLLAGQHAQTVDLDMDGREDILILSESPRVLGWYRSDPDVGLLAQPPILSQAPFISSVEVHDFDGDGDLDLLCGSAGAVTLFWVENLGSGNWSDMTVLAAGSSNLSFLDAADLDGDGDLDLAYTAFQAGVGTRAEWRENTSVAGGPLSFGPPHLLSTPAGRYTDLMIADLDGDGGPDVVLADETVDRVVMHRNLGGGSFAPKSQLAPGTGSVRPFHLAAADFDGDGDLDVYASERFDADVRLLINQGGGSFSNYLFAYLGSGTINSLDAVDANGDGIDDLLISFDSSGRYGWLRNQGGAFGPLNSFTQPPSTLITPLVGDFDADGDEDLAAASALGLWLHQGTGALGAAAFEEGRRLTYDIAHAPGVDAADLDGDGDADLLLALSPYEEGYAWSENLGGGSFNGVTQTFPMTVPLECRPLDLDGDGDLDLVGIGGSFDSIQASVRWAENLGSGQFADSITIYSELADSGATVGFGDMEGDGDVDFFITHREGFSFRLIHLWVESTESGFVRMPQVPFGEIPERVEIGDVDGDGRADAMYRLSASQRIAWRPNLGSGGFGQERMLVPQSSLNVNDLQLVDLNQDGNLDVVALSGAGTFWFAGLGAGTFASAAQLDPDPVSDVFVADAGEDGDLDLFLQPFNQPIRWLENTGGTQFSAPVVLPGSNSPALALADLDGDLDLDLIKRTADGAVAVNRDGTRIGSGFCGPSRLNSSDLSGAISASGSLASAANDLRLRVERLPAGTFGFFILADERGFVANPGGSQGNLCLSGSIGRLLQPPGSIFLTAPDGSASVPLNLQSVPNSQGTEAVLPGDTRYAQAWYRDANPMPTSNLTNGLVLEFR